MTTKNSEVSGEVEALRQQNAELQEQIARIEAERGISADDNNLNV